MAHKLHGLVAATHSPFDASGALNLAAVEKQAQHLQTNGVATAFICGSTGECHSLTVDERRALAERWMQTTRGSQLQVVVHAGSNCVTDSITLARHAQDLGAAAVAAFSPSYFKPRSIDALIDCCAQIAAAAPSLPFYYYDIPSMTGVSFPMPEFLEKAQSRIPNLAGIKFTNADLMAYLLCLNADGGRWDVPYGMDEAMLGALATGAKGFVGSTYNFAAPIYTRLIAAHARGDLRAARTEQLRSAILIGLLASYGYMSAAKALMKMLGVPVGPPRLPHGKMSHEQTAALRRDLEALRFFDWK